MTLERHFHRMLAATLTLLTLISATAPRADDIDIYTQQPAQNPYPPLVVLTLDLNINLAAIVCSNAIAGSAGTDAAACSTVQSLLVLPLLENLLGLQIDSLANSLGVGGLASGLISSLGLGTTVSNLTNALRAVTHRTDNALTQIDVVRLLAFRLVRQLVGTRFAVLLSNADSCLPGSFANPRRSTSTCSNGAFVLLAAQEILQSTVNSTLSQMYSRLDQIAAAPPNGAGDATPPFQGKEIYYEMVRYLTGADVYNAPLDADNAVQGLRDPAAESGGHYLSPLASVCGDIYVLNVMLTNPLQDGESDADIKTTLPDVDLNGNNSLTMAEMAEYLRDTGFSHGSTRYYVHSHYLLNGVGTQTSLLSNLVNGVFTLPLAINPLAITNAQTDFFKPVNSISASFLEPGVMLARGDHSAVHPELLAPLFLPDQQRKPYWFGNLKKLSLITGSDGEPQVVDALDAPAIDGDGRIRPEALSLWTDANLLPLQTGSVYGRDGRIVNRGGAGMFIKNPPGASNGSNSRQMFFDKNASGALEALNVNRTNVDLLKTDLGTTDDLEASMLLLYARGYETNQSTLTLTQYQGLLGFVNGLVTGLTNLIRSTLGVLLNGVCTLLPSLCPPLPAVPAAVEPPAKWLLGDILHSRPLAIDYGQFQTIDGQQVVTPKFVLFTGTNAGVLHALRNEAGTGLVGGQELWAFMPRAVMKILKTQRDAQPIGLSRPYGVDGAPVAYIEDHDGVISAAQGDKVYLYFGLRRGGKAYYALNVTNPETTPPLLWRLQKTTAAGSDFEQLGLTFSNPRVERMRIKNTSGVVENKVVLIFGGGYSGGYTSANAALAKDLQDDGTIGTDDAEGNALFIVDALDGSLLWKAIKGTTALATTANPKVFKHADMKDSVPSEITTVDNDGDGYMERAYFGDTGGRVWRADFNNADRTLWQAVPVINAGRHDPAYTSTALRLPQDRRFFERPDFVHVRKGGDTYDAVVITSGNRENPLGRTVINWLYVYKDHAAVPLLSAPNTHYHADFADLTDNCLAEETCTPTGLSTGWKLRLGATSSTLRPGEKGLSTPTSIAGTILFETYVPADPAAPVCFPQEGTSRSYAIRLTDASPTLLSYAADSDGDDDDYSTALRASGIGAMSRWIAPGKFLRSDFEVNSIQHKRFWRTFWRERLAE